MTNKEEPVDLGEKWRIMKRSHGEKKTLAVWMSVSAVVKMLSAAMAYLLIEILSPAHGFFSSLRNATCA